MSESEWSVPVDPVYAGLIRAMKRRADEIASGLEAKIADIYFVREVGNTAWCLLRLDRAADTTLFLLHGTTTIALREAVDGDVGIEVADVPWGRRLLPLMQMLAARDDAEFDHCHVCGHELVDRAAGTLPIPVCPACGYAGGDPAHFTGDEGDGA